MRINHNIPALRALHQLTNTSNVLDKTMERLSSGLRINRAADDAAGLAIAQKMDTQVRGLKQANRNAMDGISLIQTAEGALNEVHAMLQRIRELAVQVSNGTYDAQDREAVQDEVKQLQDEIQRISDHIEFNERKLLNGEIDRRAFPDNEKVATIVSLSDTVSPGQYQLNISKDATKATASNIGKIDLTFPITEAQAGTININGEETKIAVGDSAETVFNKIRNVCETIGADVFTVDAFPGGDVTTFGNGKYLKMQSKEYGSDYSIDINASNSALLTGLGLKTEKVIGSDIEATITATDGGFSSTATVSTKGNIITVTDVNGFEMKYDGKKDAIGTALSEGKSLTEAIAAGEAAGLSNADATTRANAYLDNAVDVLLGANGAGEAAEQAAAAAGGTSTAAKIAAAVAEIKAGILAGDDDTTILAVAEVAALDAGEKTAAIEAARAATAESASLTAESAAVKANAAAAAAGGTSTADEIAAAAEAIKAGLLAGEKDAVILARAEVAALDVGERTAAIAAARGAAADAAAAIKAGLSAGEDDAIIKARADVNSLVPGEQDAAIAAVRSSFANQPTDSTTIVKVLDAGPLDLQIGANEGQFMEIRIQNLSPQALGIDKINLSTADGAQKAITVVDDAINMISSVRSKLGAYQNRLEHTVANLDVAAENMTSSLSRIQDADMAQEMSEYTQKNVVSQAGMSMLAQANQRPQQILQLLQG